ncbi:MAG: PilN domain-containing protein [Thermoleophilaceae bacterium]
MRPVNLLPESSRRHRPSGKLGGSAYAVVGLLAVLLAMAVAYVLTTNDISDKEGKIATAEAEAAEARQRAGSFSAFSGFAQIKEARLASVRDRAAVRFDWERLMREVSHVIPDDVWLLDMSASTAPQDASGGAATTTPGTAAPLNPSLTLSGCAKGQPSVAALMVRLRKLHRTEDVQLTESGRQDPTEGEGATDGAASSGDSCVSDRYRFAVTVSFSAPNPAEEAAGGAVPAALGGGS